LRRAGQFGYGKSGPASFALRSARPAEANAGYAFSRLRAVVNVKIALVSANNFNYNAGVRHCGRQPARSSADAKQQQDGWEMEGMKPVMGDEMSGERSAHSHHPLLFSCLGMTHCATLDPLIANLDLAGLS
jgi:hypothetical protein